VFARATVHDDELARLARGGDKGVVVERRQAADVNHGDR
jgi:hypothetical protein